MRKLKCTDCGGTLGIAVNDYGMAIGTCSYCSAEYLLDRQRKKYVIVEHRFPQQAQNTTPAPTKSYALALPLWLALFVAGFSTWLLVTLLGHQPTVSLSDLEGDIIFNVGGQGPGPGQFREDALLVGIDASGQSVVMDDDRMHVFAADGRFIKSYPPREELRNADPIVVLPNGDLIFQKNWDDQFIRFDTATGKIKETVPVRQDIRYNGRSAWLAVVTADGGFATYQREERDFLVSSSLPAADTVVFYGADLREKRRLTDLIVQAVAADPMVGEPPVVTDLVINGAGTVFLNLLAREDTDSRGGIYEFNNDGKFQRRISVEHGFFGDLALGPDGAVWYSDPWLSFLQRIDGPEITKYDLSEFAVATDEVIGAPDEIAVFPNGDIGLSTLEERLVRIALPEYVLP